MTDRTFARKDGHDLLGWHSLGMVHTDLELDGNDLFDGLHLALDAIKSEGPSGTHPDAMFELVGELAEISERLFDIRNKLRKAKGLKELRVDQALTKGGANP